MRSEEKEVDGPDLQRAEAKESLLDRDDKDLVQGLANERGVDQDGELLAAVRTILDKEPLVVRDLGLPARETQALEMMQSAVEGRQVRMDTFLYADDRRQLLEQALAVLQPTLSSSRSVVMETLRDELGAMVDKVHTLRLELQHLEDAQERVDEQTGEQKAKPADSSDDDDSDEKPTGSSLFDGPEVDHTKPATKIWVDPDPHGIPAQKLKVIQLEPESPEEP